MVRSPTLNARVVPVSVCTVTTGADVVDRARFLGGIPALLGEDFGRTCVSSVSVNPIAYPIVPRGASCELKFFPVLGPNIQLAKAISIFNSNK